MYFGDPHKQETPLNGSIGGVLNAENAENTLALENIEDAAQAGSRQNDFALMENMYTGTAKRLLPYVKETVDKNCREGSPIMRDIGPDREHVHMLTELSLNAAARSCDAAEETMLDARRRDWDHADCLYSLAQALVLSEIFLIKRRKN